MGRRSLRVVGAGLPRTGTTSLGEALARLLDGPYYTMSTIPGHPFDLGAAWDRVLGGDIPDWDRLFDGYVAAVDWPASMFWRELSEAYPDALVLLSVRDSAETWWRSVEETILPYARMAVGADWRGGRGLATLFERFAGTPHWDDQETLMAAYERHNGNVRKDAPDRFLEWRAVDGWEPICRKLALPMPDEPFPWVNRRSEWR